MGDFGDFSSSLFGGEGGGSVLNAGDYNFGFGDAGGASTGASSWGAPEILAGAGAYGGGMPGGSAVTTPAGAGGMSLTDALSGIGRGFGDVARTVLPVAQIGAAGLGAYSNYQAAQQRADQSKLAERAATRQDQISAAAQQQAQPLSQFATEQLQRAGAGQIQPAIQARIDEWVRAAKAKADAYAAGSGQGNSTQLRLWHDWIDRQGQAMQAAAIDAQQRTGIQAAGQAANTLAVGGSVAGQAAQNATAQGSGIDQLLATANAALNRLSASTA